MSLGRIVVALAILGLLFAAVLVPGFFFWWGRLPGDIVVHVRGDTYMFLPVGSCVFASFMVSVVGWLWRKAR